MMPTWINEQLRAIWDQHLTDEMLENYQGSELPRFVRNRGADVQYS